MVIIQSAEVSLGQRRSDDRVPLISGSRYREPPIRHLWLGLRRSSWFLMVYLAVFVMYLSLGAFVFGSMEQPVERQFHLEIRNRIEKFLLKYPILPGLSCSKKYVHTPLNDSFKSEDSSSLLLSFLFLPPNFTTRFFPPGRQSSTLRMFEKGCGLKDC